MFTHDGPSNVSSAAAAFTTLAECDRELARLDAAAQDPLVRGLGSAVAAIEMMKQAVTQRRAQLVAEGANNPT